MRFTYQYRTKENELRSGTVAASNRDAAFAVLKSQGIRPSRLEDAPGFFNKLFGRGKRWIAIFLLSMNAAWLLYVSVNSRNKVEKFEHEEADRAMYEARSQIYGDPAILNEAFDNEWRDVFDAEGDRFLAAYAIPGREVSWKGTPPLASLMQSLSVNTVVLPEDFSEVAKMKRMVNGIKREARTYLNDGGTIESYVRRLDARQKEEQRFFARVKTELSGSSDSALWLERNQALRKMGLPMIEPQDSSSSSTP